MTVQLVGILLGILFLLSGFLHYRQHQQAQRLKDAAASSVASQLMILGLCQILINKGLVTEEDIAGKPKEVKS